jgi:hypothetical protein
MPAMQNSTKSITAFSPPAPHEVCSYLHVSLVVTNRPHKTAQKCQLPPHLPFVGYVSSLSSLSPLPVASFGSSVVRVCFFSFPFFFFILRILCPGLTSSPTSCPHAKGFLQGNDDLDTDRPFQATLTRCMLARVAQVATSNPPSPPSMRRERISTSGDTES